MFSNITSPTLLIDQNKVRKNIEFMASKAARLGLDFRPHFKTHQSAKIGEWFKEYGVQKITVSSVSMAEYFARAGWKDITVAFPVNIREIEKINDLARKINLNLLVESEEAIRYLSENLRHPVSVFIKIDVGYHRTGINPNDIRLLEKLIHMISDSGWMKWKGFLTHAGHTYHARGKEKVLEIHQQSLDILGKLRRHFASRYGEFYVSYGDTPSCSLAENFDGIDEIRPGNFVFYDVMQWRIGSCQLKDIAVAVACPVVAKHPDRNEIVIYGGAVHLSKESVELEDGRKVYGLLVWLHDRGWNIPEIPIPLTKISQEHGILKVAAQEMDKISVGDLIGILPVHSCLTMNLMRYREPMIF